MTFKIQRRECGVLRDPEFNKKLKILFYCVNFYNRFMHILMSVCN